MWIYPLYSWWAVVDLEAWWLSDSAFHQGCVPGGVLCCLLRHTGQDGISGCPPAVREEQQSGDVSLFHRSFTQQFHSPLFPSLYFSRPCKTVNMQNFPVLLLFLNSFSNVAAQFLDFHPPFSLLQLLIPTNSPLLHYYQHLQCLSSQFQAFYLQQHLFILTSPFLIPSFSSTQL